MAGTRAKTPQSGIMSRVRPGIVSGVGTIYQRHPRTAAEMSAAFGRTPSHGWLFDAPNSPITPLFGGENLVAGATPPAAYAVPTPYAGRRATDFAGGGSQNRLEAGAAATFDDDGATSHAWLIHCIFGNAAANRAILGKAADSTVYWYARIESNGSIRMLVDDNVTAVTNCLISADHQGADTWLWFAIDRAADLSRATSRLGSATADISAVGSLSNSGIGALFQVGRVEFPANSADMDVIALYRFSGANAEGDPAANLAQFARYADAA